MLNNWWIEGLGGGGGTRGRACLYVSCICMAVCETAWFNSSIACPVSGATLCLLYCMCVWPRDWIHFDVLRHVIKFQKCNRYWLVWCPLVWPGRPSLVSQSCIINGSDSSAAIAVCLAFFPLPSSQTMFYAVDLPFHSRCYTSNVSAKCTAWLCCPCPPSLLPQIRINLKICFSGFVTSAVTFLLGQSKSLGKQKWRWTQLMAKHATIGTATMGMRNDQYI